MQSGPVVASIRSLETVVPATSLPQSSATVLFVLRDLLARAGDASEGAAALAFGPGLAVEAATLTLRTQA